jgi:hypothetical protein
MERMTDDAEAVFDDFIASISRYASKTSGLIWHYTTAAGLLGILSSGSIWATGLSFLNDSSEGRHVWEKMVELLAAKLPKGDAAAARVALDDFDARVTELAVACFSRDGDLLSQWRTYSQGAGFAVGFDLAQLATFWTGERREGILATASYSLEDAEAAADRYVIQAVEAWNSLFPNGIISVAPPGLPPDPNDDELEPMAQALYQFSHRLAPLMMSGAFHKHPQFAEEQEWRLVTHLAGADRSMPSSRVQGQGIALYRPISFQSAPLGSPIRAIRVGPGLLFKPQAQAIQHTLRGLGYRNIEILNSNIPLRFV